MNFFDNYFFTTLFHAEVPRIILRTEPDHIIVKYNEAYQIATSTQSRSLEGVSLWDAFDPDEAGPGSGKLLAEALSKASSTKKTVNMPPFSYYVPSPNGEEIISMWRMLEIIPFLEKTGECNYLLLTTNNITHEILSKEALDRGLAREQILVDELNYTNKELTVANSALLVSMEELNVRNAELLDSEVNLLNFNRDLESTVRVRTGQQRAAKAEALKQRDHLTSLFMQAPAGITVLAGPEFIFELVNPHYQELFPGKKLRGRKFFEALPELKGSLIDSILHDVYQTGEAFEGNEIHMQIKSLATDETEDRYFNFIYQPRVNADEVTDGILVLIFEITEMVINRKEKAKSDNLLKFSIEAADIGTYSIDAKNRKLIASTRLKELFGYRADEDMPYEAAVAQITDDFRAEFIQKVENAFTKGDDFHLEYTVIGFHDQKLRWVRAVGKMDPNVLDQEYYFSGAIIDITAQVEAKMIEQNLNEELAAINEELNALNEQLFSTNDDLNLSKLELQHSLDLIRESEERFRIMADGSDILIAVGDNTGKAVYFNEAWTRFTGRPQTEILDFGWADLIHPDDKENFLNLYLASFKNQVPFTGEFRILNKAGNYGWLLATDRPRFNTDGTFAGYISSSIDITEQKQDDQRKNDFIGMVSHELKTPLTSLSAYVQILLNRARKNDDEFTKTALEKANRQVGKMNEMINGFLNVSRLESGKIHIDKQDFDLAFLVKEAEEDLESTNETHTVIFAPLERTMIHADREKIAHVISNLISNAFKYSPKNSTIHVACTTKNNSAYFSVKDEGMGISKDDIPMLFDRYFRVKGNNMHGISGFGIGLYLSSEIIKRHDGTIWAESELNRGSKFIFTLPVLPQ